MAWKNKIWVLCLALVLLLTGCAGTTVEDMYAPPRRSEAYNELQEAKDNGMTTNEWLEEELGKHPEEIIKPILESVNDKLNKNYEE